MHIEQIKRFSQRRARGLGDDTPRKAEGQTNTNSSKAIRKSPGVCTVCNGLSRDRRGWLVGWLGGVGVGGGRGMESNTSSLSKS